MKQQTAAFLLVILPFCLTAQPGGGYVFGLLNLPPSARTNALGGTLIPVRDADVNQAFLNPGSLNQEMHQGLSLTHSFLFAGIARTQAATAWHKENWNSTLFGGLQYIDYGAFLMTDDNANIQGAFSGSDMGLTLGLGRTYSDQIQYGISGKFLISSVETYTATALAFDFGATYTDETGRFMAGLVFRNVGGNIRPYGGGNPEPLPFDIQLGMARQLEHLPLRFSIVAHHLNELDIRYADNPFEDKALVLSQDSADQPKPKKHLADKIARHFAFGAEFLFSESFRLRAGYNHLVRAELSIPGRRGLSGFSLGLGIRVKKFTLDYGMASYHLASGTHQISLSTPLGEWF